MAHTKQNLQQIHPAGCRGARSHQLEKCQQEMQTVKEERQGTILQQGLCGQMLLFVRYEHC